MSGQVSVSNLFVHVRPVNDYPRVNIPGRHMSYDQSRSEIVLDFVDALIVEEDMVWKYYLPFCRNI